MAGIKTVMFPVRVPFKSKTLLEDSAVAEAFAKAVDMEPEEYRPRLLKELKNVHSVLDPVRYDDRFLRILGIQADQ